MSRKRTNYNTSDCKDNVWNKAKKIPNTNPKVVRQDPYGKRINYNSHGKSTTTGWNVDHIKPTSRGGSNDIGNLQALRSNTNKSKGNSLVKKSRHSKTNK